MLAMVVVLTLTALSGCGADPNGSGGASAGDVGDGSSLQGPAAMDMAPRDEEGVPLLASPEPQVFVPFNAYQFDAGAVKIRPVDAATGALGAIFQNVSIPNPVGGTVTGNGKFAFMASNTTPSKLYSFTVDAVTGTLTATSPASILVHPTAWTGPRQPIADPTGTFLYVLNVGTGFQSISAFAIDDVTGTLTEISGSPFALPAAPPQEMVMDPTGRFLYVAVGALPPAANVLPFAIDPATGALTAGTPVLTGTAGSFGSFPRTLTVDPAGNHLYVAASNTNKMSVFAINAVSGNLSPVAGSPFTFSGGGITDSLTFDRTGKYLYLGTTNTGTAPNLVALGVNSATGAVTGALPGSPYTTLPHNYASHVSVDPSGKFLYVGSQFGSDGVDGFAIDSGTGGLTRIAGMPLAGLNTQSLSFTKKVE